MTTVARPLPEHGTYARANGSPGRRAGCDCEPCVLVKRATWKRLKVNRQLGRSARVNATPARERLKLLKQTMSWTTLTGATKCDESNLIAIYNGERAEINRTTHNKIMAVGPTTKADRGMYVNATGSTRRIRAMQVVGHSYRAIAEAANTTDERVHLIAEGRQSTVRQAIADRIDDAYKQLAHRPAPINRFTTRTRNTAAAKGWHGPLIWDEDTIDDPTFDPDAPEAPRYMRLGEDGLWLEGLGLTREQIATRLDVTRDYLDHSIRRYRAALAGQQVAS